MINYFYQMVLIPWQSHDGIYACSLGLTMLGGDGMDSTIECIFSSARGFQLLCPIVPGA
jgi:hypothetical protein